MESVVEVFDQFKQLPDWDRYPLPQVVYDTFKLPKPKPSVSLMESLTYTPPPSVPLNRNGKAEIRKPAEGGVREIKEFMSLPVEQTLIPDESEPQPEEYSPLRILQTIVSDLKDQTSSDTQPDSAPEKLTPPTADNTTGTQPE